MIRMIQVLCPDRHCLVGVAYDDNEWTPEHFLRNYKLLVQDLFDRHILNPWCGICGSSLLTFEDTLTKYHSMEEAAPEIYRLEEENELARRLIGGKY